MGTQHRRTISIWSGFFLIVIGFLLFIVAYFLLPLYITAFNCFDSCTPPIYRTAWESSLQVMSHFSNIPIVDAFVLVLHYLPPLAALMIFACGIAFIIHPHRFFVRWFYRSWLTGIITLLIALPFLNLLIRPEIGYLGMLLSYGVFYGAYRLLLAQYATRSETS